MKHTASKLNELINTIDECGKGLVTSPEGRGSIIPYIFSICQQAKEKSEHALASQVLINVKILLENTDPFLENGTSEENIFDFEFYRYIREQIRYHLFSANKKAKQLFLPSIGNNLHNIKNEIDSYKEIPFSEIYPFYKSYYEKSFYIDFIIKIFQENLDTLANSPKILDLAVGGGFDMCQFIKQGFQVVGNDYDALFLEQTRKTLLSNGLNGDLVCTNWKTLSHCHKEKHYNGAYLLGNSLTYLLNTNDQIQSLREIRKVLKKDAIFVLDVRNYDYILNNSEYILKAPIENFHFMYNSCYIGDRVLCYPIEISNNQVVFEFVYPEKKIKAHIKLYPFREKELDNLIETSNFKIIEKKYDSQGIFLNQKNGHYDFITYVVKAV